MRVSLKIVFFAFIICNIVVPQVYSCVVSPSSAAVVTGNSISVVCRADKGNYITHWRRGDDSNAATDVYRAPGNDPEQFPKYIAEGYSVNDTNTSQVTLTVNNANSSYVGYYWCNCFISKPPDNAYISVLDSDPKFSASDSLRVEDSFVLTCSLSVTGIVNTSIAIIDYSGNVLKNDSAYISSSISKTHSLTYNVPQFREEIYYCNVSLRNNTNESAVINVFERQLNVAMHLAAGNTSIYSENFKVCQNGGFCLKGVPILCKLEGYKASNYQWTIYFNGTVSTLSDVDSYSTQYVGLQTIQCSASKRIDNTFYYGSANFTTNVTEEVYVSQSFSSGESNTPLIVGLVVGLGGGLLLILIIIIAVILWKRQKRQQPKDSQVQELNEERKQYAQVTKKGSSQPGTNSYAKSNGSSETVLVENHLYSGTNNRDGTYNTSIDPSDGGIQEGGYSALDEFSVKEKS